MPFIKPQRRAVINMGGLGALGEIQPGDRCYLHYKKMVDTWKANPRWTTAHEIFMDIISNPEQDPEHYVARHLAWQVFFIRYVMPYEMEKAEENGDI